MFAQVAALRSFSVIAIVMLTADITVTSLEGYYCLYNCVCIYFAITYVYVVMTKPTQYISLPPSTFNEGGYNVRHSTENCVSSIEDIESESMNILTCPNGELLLDKVTQANLGIWVSDEDIQLFNTWSESTIQLNEAFITLQFLNNITVTRLVVYCLVLQDLKVREPKKFRLFSSTMDSVFPTTEIKGIDTVFTMTSSGSTTIRRMNNNDDDDDDGLTFSTYEYRKYNLIIPEDRQVSLNSLRISMDFEGDNWIFISEVEAFHIGRMSKFISILLLYILWTKW